MFSKRKGFWESTGLVAALIIFVVGMVILIGFLYLYGKNTGGLFSNLQQQITQSLCTSIGATVRWILNC